MVRTQRRQAPRMPVNGLAYVNLDPDNGGIILNISEGGLCFQSTAPVKRTETIRFWFSYCGQRPGTDASKGNSQGNGVSRFIETGSKLAWTDKTQTRGGLRFTNLPAEAREQIRDWIRHPQGALSIENEKSGAPLTSPYKSPLNAIRVSPNAARGVSASLEALFRNIETQSRRLGTGFSGGLVAGILVSTIIVSVFSLVSHRSELGSVLIQLGERFGGRSSSQPISAGTEASSKEPSPTLPDPGPVPPRPKVSSPHMTSLDPHPVMAASKMIPPKSKTGSVEPKPVPALMRASQPEKLLSLATPVVAAPSGVKLQSAGPVVSSLFAASVKTSNTPSAISTAGRPSVPKIVASPALDPSASIPRTVAPEMVLETREIAPVVPAKMGDVGIHSEKYLEVGKFKEKLLADKTISELSQLGFPASVIPWNRLLGKSYQVLVGPYENDGEAEAVHKDLSSRGFTPRSYERGKRDFKLPAALKVGGTSLPVGYCVVSWESYIPNAVVKIEDERGKNVTLDGSWVKRDTKYTEDAVAYLKNRDGSRTLVEIRFSGLGQALVFAGATTQQVTRH